MPDEKSETGGQGRSRLAAAESDAAAARQATNIEERHAIEERLQAVEEDLLAAGKRHAMIEGAEGRFEWYAVGAERERAERAEADDIQEIEDLIVAHARDKIQVYATKAGTFIWRPRS
jgi:hypothetical protein